MATFDSDSEGGPEAPENAFADLHLHTTASDGTDSLEDRIEQARERGLDTIAITDHDRIDDELPAGSRRFRDLEVVTGVEVRADLMSTKIELLGYFVDPDEQTLSGVLKQARTYRRNRNRELVARLNEATDLHLSYEDLSDEVRGGLGRPHLAEILVDEGYVDGIGPAFDKYLAEEGSCFVPMERVACETVLGAIHAAGGVASLAHPGRIRVDDVPTFIRAAADLGLDGIETWYPYGDVAFGVDDAARLAEEYDLLKTGGSDCHGRGSGKFRIGSVGVSAERFETLRAAALE